MGRLCQASVRRTWCGAGLFVALYPPCRHLQQPACRDGRTWRDLPLEGLSEQGPNSTQDDDARCARVHASLPVARSAGWFPSHSPLRTLGQRQSQGRPGMRARVAAAATQQSYRDLGRWCRVRICATELLLPALRRSDDHSANLCSRATDPRAAATASNTMSTELSEQTERLQGRREEVLSSRRRKHSPPVMSPDDSTRQPRSYRPKSPSSAKSLILLPAPARPT